MSSKSGFGGVNWGFWRRRVKIFWNISVWRDVQNRLIPKEYRRKAVSTPVGAPLDLGETVEYYPDKRGASLNW